MSNFERKLAIWSHSMAAAVATSTSITLAPTLYKNGGLTQVAVEVEAEAEVEA